MPTHKVKGGYKWGKSGKVYPTKAQADKQGQAIYASGWREKKKVNESFTPSKLILMGVLRKVSDELYDKGYDEDKIDNFINNRNIQLGMDGDGYTFLFNNDIMFHIEPFPQLNDVIDNASQNMIQWFENKINNIQENKNMSKKQLIRITENDLRKIIKESVNRILNEQAFSYEELKDFLMQQHYPNRTPEEQESAFNRDFEIAQKRFGSEDDENGLNAYEKFKRDIADSKARLELSMMDSRFGNNNVHDYKGKGAMYAMGASSYGKEGEEFARNDKGVGVYPRYDMDESIKHSLRKAISDLVQ